MMTTNYTPPIHDSDMFRNEWHPYRALSLRLSEADLQAHVMRCLHEPLRYYVPNGAQERMIDETALAMRESDTPVVLATYANGVGKTTAAVHILMNIIYGPQNGWMDYPEFRSSPYPRQAWICSTGDALRTKTIPLVESLLVPGTYTASKEGKTHISRYDIQAGEKWEQFSIFLKTYDQDPKTYESADVGYIICDEPMPEGLWKAVKSRRREGCLVLLPMTPLYCDPYIVAEIMGAAESGRAGYRALTADVYEACRERGIRGHLRPNIIDSMVAEYDDEEREARAFGRMMYFVRAIYGSVLNRDRHFVDPAEYPLHPDSRILHVVDPHDGRYSAALWCAVQPNGRKIIFMEYPEDHSAPFWTMRGTATTDEEVGAWVRMEGTYPLSGMRRPVRILDRHFGWQTRGDTDFSTLYIRAGEKYGKPMQFRESYRIGDVGHEIAYGHRMVRELFSNTLEDGRPEIVIWTTCLHSWRGLTHYIRRNEVTKSDSERAIGTGRIVEKFKDFPDLLRYLACADTTHRLPMTPGRKADIEFEKLLAGEPKEAVW